MRLSRSTVRATSPHCARFAPLTEGCLQDQVDNGKTESRHPGRTAEGVGGSGRDEASAQLAGSRAIPTSYYTLGLHPKHLELAGSLSYPHSSLPFSSNLPVAHTPSSPATTPENGVIHPIHPFNHHASQPIPPPPVGGPFVIYPVNLFNPHANQPTPPPPMAGSYLPPAMVYPASGPSQDALLSMLRMDPRYANLFSYAPGPFSSVPVQQQQGFAFQTGPPYPGTPL